VLSGSGGSRQETKNWGYQVMITVDRERQEDEVGDRTGTMVRRKSLDFV
jgi:hypothetical protein